MAKNHRPDGKIVMKEPEALAPYDHPLLADWNQPSGRNTYLLYLNVVALAELLAREPFVTVVLRDRQTFVVDGWEAVLLARRYRVTKIAVRISTLPEEALPDWIGLTRQLHAHDAPARGVTEWRYSLNERLLENGGSLLDKKVPREQSLRCFFPSSTAYRQSPADKPHASSNGTDSEASGTQPEPDTTVRETGSRRTHHALASQSCPPVSAVPATPPVEPETARATLPAPQTTPTKTEPGQRAHRKKKEPACKSTTPQQESLFPSSMFEPN